jgi:hypothetical protein
VTTASLSHFESKNILFNFEKQHSFPEVKSFETSLGLVVAHQLQ